MLNSTRTPTGSHWESRKNYSMHCVLVDGPHHREYKYVVLRECYLSGSMVYCYYVSTGIIAVSTKRLTNKHGYIYKCSKKIKYKRSTVAPSRLSRYHLFSAGRMWFSLLRQDLEKPSRTWCLRYNSKHRKGTRTYCSSLGMLFRFCIRAASIVVAVTGFCIALMV